jgi:hypothetical protein
MQYDKVHSQIIKLALHKMDEISKTLIQISNFKDLEDTLTTGKFKELQRNQHQFLVSVKPSNLVKPTSMGEKFAPDSCISEDFLKYVWGNSLIENKQSPQALFCNKDFTADPKASSIPATPEFIAPLIVYDRPKFTRSEPLEELLNKTLPKEKPPITPKKETIKPALKPKVAHPPKISKKPGVSKPKTPKRYTEESISVTIPSYDSSVTMKPKLKRKKHKAPSKKSSISGHEFSSEYASETSPKKNVRWSESTLIEQEKEKIEEDYKEKRKELFENLKLPVPTSNYEDLQSASISKSSKSSKSLEELEKIVKDQHEKLLREGVVSPEALSASQRFKSSYEDLDREIQNIKRMLYEKEEELKHMSSRSDQTLRSSDKSSNGPMMVKEVFFSPESSEPHKAAYESSSSSENESLSQLSYSSDDGEQSIDDWLSPRFPSGRSY